MSGRDRFWFVLGHFLASLARLCLARPSEPVWISADGRVTPYSKLGDDHLRNCIRMLERKGQQPEKLLRLRQEADRRWGEHPGFPDFDWGDP